VTCKKWNHIFLNEGFATYVANLGEEAVSPEFYTKELGWYTGYFQGALRKDAQAEIHPVVKTEDYFGDFDAITYSKVCYIPHIYSLHFQVIIFAQGASLIKMMENILSRETLMNGLRTYLNTL
jgi:aminopeptidase N